MPDETTSALPESETATDSVFGFTRAEVNEIVLQASLEYEHALKYRQKREGDWQTIEDLYYGKKKKSLVTRANVHIPKMQGTIETFISKVDDQLLISYEAVEEGDRPKVNKMNALLKRDMQIGNWDLKDVVGKKEGAMIGRSIFKKYSTSEDGFTDYLEVVDHLDFLIDPLAGGLEPMERARFLGQDNIIRTIYDLDDAGIYDQVSVKEMGAKLHSDRSADNSYASRQARRTALGLSDAVYISDDAVKLVEWYTIYKGKKVYLLFSKEHMTAVRCLPLIEVFASNDHPFATWAPFPRLDEFWTPGLGELLKEPNIIQNVVLSQILDNNAYRNYGMKAYDTTKVTNPAELVPKPMGKVGVNGNPRDAILQIEFPTLDNAVAAYNLVDQIYDKETGVTASAKGMPNAKRMSATEFAGLLDQVSDRFFAANNTYKSCMRRIAKLYYYGVEENMTKARRIRILGARGFEWAEVSAQDVKGDFDVMISSGVIDEQNKIAMRDRFGEYVVRNRQNTRINQRFLDEKEAQIFGFENDELERLMNPEMEADWEILSEAAQEEEKMLRKDIKPNSSATTGHIEHHLDYIRTTDGLSPEVRKRMLAHCKEELPIAQANEELKANKLIRDTIGARALDVSNEMKANIENPPANRLQDVPAGVDPAAYAEALKGAGNGTSGAAMPAASMPSTMPEQVRMQAIQNAPTAPGVQPSA